MRLGEGEVVEDIQVFRGDVIDMVVALVDAPFDEIGDDDLAQIRLAGDRGGRWSRRWRDDGSGGGCRARDRGG